MKTTIKMYELMPGFKSYMGRKARESRNITASDWIAMDSSSSQAIIIDYLVNRLASAEMELRKARYFDGHLKVYSDL